MATQFELFVNQEMPKRVYTNQFPLTAGHVPVATGVGLEVEARTLTTSDISDISSYATQEDLSNVLADANEYADGLVVGLWDDRGAYTVNAAGNINYPSSAGSGVAGALMKGDIFTVAGAVAGISTINNIAVNNGDTVRALVDNPSATDNAHWAIAENNIGYVPENRANKTTNTDLSGATGTYPDTPTVKSYIDKYDISAAAINSTGTVTLTRTESDLTFQVPTAVSGLSFDPNTGVLTSSYTNDATSTTITVAANEVSDNVFRIKDNTDSTKKIAFEASDVGTGQTKTISMPNFDVSLSPIRRRIQTSGSGLENLLLNNTETYIEITGGTTITIPVYPPYTANAGASGYLFNATNVAKTIRFQHTWSGEISSFVGTCNHFFPETNETGGYTSTVPGSSGNTYTDIQLLPGETLRFVASGTKTLFTVNIYRNSSNVMYENTFRIKRSALESHGVRFETSAVTEDRVITMPDANVNLGLVGQAASTSTNGYLTSTDWNTFNNKNNKNVRIIRVSTQNYTVTTADADGNTSIYMEYTGAGNPTITIPASLTNPITIFNSSYPKNLNITWSESYPVGGMGATSPSVIPGYDGIRVYPYRNDGTQYYQVEWVSRTRYSSNMFFIYDVNDITKNIGFKTSAIGSGQFRIITMPDANVNLGNLSSVATTDSNNLSGTRNRIVGGSSNTVSGTDNIVIAGSNCTINGIGNTVLGGELCNANTKQGTRLLGRKAIAYTDFEQVDCIYYGTAHSGGARQFYDRFAPNIRTYNTYMFGDITDLSVQNSYSLAFKPKAVIGLASSVEPAAAFHQIRIVALKMGGAAGAASMEVSLMCRYLNGVYTIVERLDSAVVGTAGIMGTFTFSIDASGYLIIQKSSQSSDWGYFLYGKAYHTATQ